MRAAIFFAMVLALVAADITDIDEGKDIFNNVCGDFCHQVPVPSRLTINQWTSGVGDYE